MLIFASPGDSSLIEPQPICRCYDGFCGWYISTGARGRQHTPHHRQRHLRDLGGSRQGLVGIRDSALPCARKQPVDEGTKIGRPYCLCMRRTRRIMGWKRPVSLEKTKWILRLSVGSMMVQHRRRWPIFQPTLINIPNLWYDTPFIIYICVCMKEKISVLVLVIPIFCRAYVSFLFGWCLYLC